MSCTNPMLMKVLDLADVNLNIIQNYKKHGWKIDLIHKRGYKLVSKQSRHLELEHIDEYKNMEVIEVPCGNCIRCRLDYSKGWANRCTLEASQYAFNYFITLTYDDDHVVQGVYNNPTLVREHVTEFLNNLRKKFKRKLGHVGIRYFGCGEYGPSTMRPHYHIILFNCPIPDLTIDFVDEEGHVTHHKSGVGGFYEYSQFVKDCWKYGNILIADCNWNTSSYVSAYVLKKQKGVNSKVYADFGIKPPFNFQSTNPGIGATYYYEHKEDLLNIPTLIVPRDKKSPLISGLPRYFKKLLKREHADQYDNIVDGFKDKITKKRSLLKGQSTINHQREIDEFNIESKNKAFNRDF